MLNIYAYHQCAAAWAGCEPSASGDDFQDRLNKAKPSFSLLSQLTLPRPQTWNHLMLSWDSVQQACIPSMRNGHSSCTADLLQLAKNQLIDCSGARKAVVHPRVRHTFPGTQSCLLSVPGVTSAALQAKLPPRDSLQ